MSSEIYNWAQRYSFTELSQAIRDSRQKGEQKKDEKAPLTFIIPLLAPPLAIFVLAVVLPLWKDPLIDILNAPDANNGMVMLAAHQSINGAAATQADDLAVAELLARRNALEIERAFLKSRQFLATSDSIGLSINLIDSVASIELAGVRVRQCKIVGIKMSGRLQRLRTYRAAATWLSNPFVLQNATASIPKVPIRVIEAPRDTVEARARNDETMATEQGDVYFRLNFDRHLSLSISQTQRMSMWGWPRRLRYILRRSVASAREDLATLAGLKLPTSRLHIRLEISKEDATAIYRALPQNAAIALRL